MSAIDPRTVDPAQPHHSSNMGHEMSDFSWTTVLWLLPISVFILVLFTVVSLYWFRGAKTGHVNVKEAQFSTEELKLHRAKESEFLNSYKVLDKEAGKVRIPIARAMELVVQESQGKGRIDWTPITDTYLLGAAFTAAPSAPAVAAGAVPSEVAPAAGNPAAAKPATSAPVLKAQQKPSDGRAAGTEAQKKAP